ncbi:7-deoxyloganetin glucosyltransferase-like protein [Cinnamomum micranthum f. kanehirae]|uniref:Glycosyltransferase n=1 Tax=Cinnamomum micranthum f. kanehirae TaxID=337451 RepID=A0A443PNS7_9MAGN|nr:7-deoxyloganetin glucosyltransferase-like protein [Cinnamomum micranthum f. kanehirae]
MGSEAALKPHLICVPYPAQGHISPMLQLAKLLHYRGFYITFVNTEFNHQRLVRSRGPDSVMGLDDFRFETIPDGLPTLDQDRTQDISALSDSISKNCHPPFLSLLKKLNSTPGAPPVTCIVSDAVMSFTLQAAEELGIPEYLFFTPSACGVMGYLHYPELIERGYIPLKDESCLTNGYLDTSIDWIPGMKDIRLRDLPSFIRTTDPNDIMISYDLNNVQNAPRAKAVILNTVQDLERDVLDAITSKFSLRLISIGPLHVFSRQIPDGPSKSIGSNLWKEDTTCLDWLDQKEPLSVLYVNFGSIAVMTAEQMREFAWGLANSRQLFLWVIRPDLVKGESAILPDGFVEETRGRCMLARWCPQERVLAHPSIGGFLTHCGWNSTVESLCGAVPMICWPFFSEQFMNCRFACKEWGVGMEIGEDVKRDKVEMVVREVMEGGKGKEMRKKAIEWKESAAMAAVEGGSSYVNMENLIGELLQYKG